MGDGILIRDLEAADETGWRLLWAGFNAFHHAAIPADATAATWRKVLAGALRGRVAVRDGRLVGFTILSVHESTWEVAPRGYIEALFVVAAGRGTGLGRRLMGDAVALARGEGWSQLTWHVLADNPARAFYDRYGAVDAMVRYRLLLG